MKYTVMLAVCAVALPCGAATVGQVDTFGDGTTQGWVVALGPLNATHPAPPQNTAAGGGPAGAGDQYLRLSATGGNREGSKLSAMNVTRWVGDFLNSGIASISMDVRNSGQTDLSLRLLFENLGAMGPTDIAFSNAAVFLPSGGGWTNIMFPINASAFTALPGGTVAGAMGAADVMRIYHSPAAGWPPEGSIVATLDVDNITANAVPEPGTMVLVLAGVALGVVRRLSR